MRIGIDAHILGKGKGGVERVLHHIVRQVPTLMPDAEFVVFVNRHYKTEFAERSNVRYCRLPISEPIVQRSLILPWLCRKQKLDLIHVQRAAPPCVQARMVVHTHDLLPLTAPADHAGFRDTIIRHSTSHSLRRADSVLTVSESVAAEIRSLFPETKEKLTAIANGVEAEFFHPKQINESRSPIHQRLDLASDYVLYLGALMARKNLEVVVRGFREFLQNRPVNAAPVKLVLAGMSRSDEYVSRLKTLAQTLIPGSVCFTGFITDGECLALLQHASAFLAPSRGEGFDLPALEAMASGIPIIASELPVHRELLGDDVLYFPHDDVGRLAMTLGQLLDDTVLHQTLATRGLRRVQQYSWAAMANRLATFYRQQLSKPTR